MISGLSCRAVLAVFLSLTAGGLTACHHEETPVKDAPILLFKGTGTSANDVKAVEAVLKGNSLSYSFADSSQLNKMSVAQLQRYQLLIVPGGNFEELGNNLTANTVASLRSAVQNGTNYLG